MKDAYYAFYSHSWWCYSLPLQWLAPLEEVFRSKKKQKKADLVKRNKWISLYATTLWLTVSRFGSRRVLAQFRTAVRQSLNHIRIAYCWRYSCVRVSRLCSKQNIICFVVTTMRESAISIVLSLVCWVMRVCLLKWATHTAHQTHIHWRLWLLCIIYKQMWQTTTTTTTMTTMLVFAWPSTCPFFVHKIELWFSYSPIAC